MSCAGSQVAAELGIFDALLEVLMDVNDHPDVHEACLVALAQLVAPAPGPDADRAWPHLRKAVNSHIMNVRTCGHASYTSVCQRTGSISILGRGGKHGAGTCTLCSVVCDSVKPCIACHSTTGQSPEFHTAIVQFGAAVARYAVLVDTSTMNTCAPVVTGTAHCCNQHFTK